jgi:hypothetical protein
MSLFFSSNYEINPIILEDDEFNEACCYGGGISKLEISYKQANYDSGGLLTHSRCFIFKNGESFNLDNLNLSWAVQNKKTGKYL